MEFVTSFSSNWVVTHTHQASWDHVEEVSVMEAHHLLGEMKLHFRVFIPVAPLLLPGEHWI